MPDAAPHRLGAAVRNRFGSNGLLISWVRAPGGKQMGEQHSSCWYRLEPTRAPTAVEL